MRVRIDTLLVERGFFPSREKARAHLMAGEVWVAGRRVDKPGTRVPADAEIEVRGRLPYVGRGGLKLEKALDVFGVAVEGLVALDAGSSTGGFTDCLLQRGAARVHAVDVGRGQLAWKLRRDPRVVVHEGTNVRYLRPEAVGEAVDLVCADLSYISLGLVFPALALVLRPGGWLIALVKPQFEAGPDRVSRGGVVRDPAVHREVLLRVLEQAGARGLRLHGLTWSPLRGPSGNLEYLAGFRKEAGESQGDPLPRVEAVVAGAWEELGGREGGRAVT